MAALQKDKPNPFMYVSKYDQPPFFVFQMKKTCLKQPQQNFIQQRNENKHKAAVHKN